jgi:ATP-dependent exoDNAse (exonuclease V) beta subunit
LLVGDGGVETEIATWRQWISAPAVVAALRKPTQALASVPLSDPGETSAPYTVELWRERRFAVHAGGDLIEGVFDRVVVERLRGVVTKVTLIDYKADHVTGDGSETAARYRNQVDAYVRALEALLKVDRSKIDAMLVLLSAGLVVTMA